MEINEEDKQILTEWYLFIAKYNNEYLNDIDHKLFERLNESEEEIGDTGITKRIRSTDMYKKWKESEEEIPFMVISNKELAEKEEIGDTVICTRCGEEHDIEYGAKELAFTTCNGASYLVGIAGKLI